MIRKDIERNTIINQYLLNHKDNFNKDIGSNIKKLRNCKKITIESFSNIISTSSSYVCQIEKGKNGLSLLKFILICNALKTKPKQILDNYIFYDDNEELLFNKLENNKIIIDN